jgi:hypothetical protein
MALYMISLEHAPERSPGVDLGVRDRVLRMWADLTETLASRGCEYRGGWVGKSSHLTWLLLDGPDAHAVDNAVIDMGLATWNRTKIYPIITMEEGIAGLPTD